MNSGWIAHRQCVNSQRLCKTHEANSATCGKLCLFISARTDKSDAGTTGSSYIMSVLIVSGGLINNNPTLCVLGLGALFMELVKPAAASRELVEKNELISVRDALGVRMDNLTRSGKKLRDEFRNHVEMDNDTWDARLNSLESKVSNALVLLDRQMRVADGSEQRLAVFNITLAQHHRELDQMFAWSRNLSMDVDLLFNLLSNQSAMAVDMGYNTTDPVDHNEGGSFLNRHAGYLHFAGILFAGLLVTSGCVVFTVLVYRYCIVKIYM